MLIGKQFLAETETPYFSTNNLETSKIHTRVHTSLRRAMRMVRYFFLSPMTMQFEMHGSSDLNSFWNTGKTRLCAVSLCSKPKQSWFKSWFHLDRSACGVDHFGQRCQDALPSNRDNWDVCSRSLSIDYYRLHTYSTLHVVAIWSLIIWGLRFCAIHENSAVVQQRRDSERSILASKKLSMLNVDTTIDRGPQAEQEVANYCRVLLFWWTCGITSSSTGGMFGMFSAPAVMVSSLQQYR